MNKSICVVYHFPCLDGLAAAYAACSSKSGCAELIPYNVGFIKPETLHQIQTSKCDIIYFLDCAPSLKMYRDLIDIHQKLVVVMDHHETNRQALAGIDTVNVMFDITKSGCMMAWEFFHPESSIPLLLQYIGERDLGQIYLGYALMNRNLKTVEDLRILVEGGERQVTTLIEEGKQYTQDVNEEFDKLQPQQRIIEINGKIHPGVVVRVNHHIHVSEFGDRLLDKYGDAFVVVMYHPIIEQPDGKTLTVFIHHPSQGKNGKVKVYFRSRGDLVNVAALVEEYKGGGHRNAAGAVITVAEFEARFSKPLYE